MQRCLEQGCNRRLYRTEAVNGKALQGPYTDARSVPLDVLVQQQEDAVMFRRATLASLICAIALAAPASAQVSLRWKFREGDVFYLDEKIIGKTTLVVEGKKSSEEQFQHRLSRFVVTKSLNNAYVLEQRIEGWKSNITGGLAGDQDDTKLMEQAHKGPGFQDPPPIHRHDQRF